jgi:hypothetical protein
VTSTPTDAEILAYVKSAARLLALPLSDAQAQRVAVHLARTSGLAALLQATPLDDHAEPAQLFVPAPFPQDDPA